MGAKKFSKASMTTLQYSLRNFGLDPHEWVIEILRQGSKISVSRIRNIHDHSMSFIGVYETTPESAKWLGIEYSA